MSNQADLKTIVRGAYDVQKLRIQMGNRIVGNFKAKLGQKPGEKEDELDAEGKEILEILRLSYSVISEGVARFPRQKNFKGDSVISSFTEYVLTAQYIDLERDEKNHFNRLKAVLQEFPIYTDWLEGIRGVGPTMAGVIISEIDISKAEYPSSLWRYAGLDVASDGQGRSRRKEHLIDTEYTTKEGEISTKKSITFNPFLKTKLVGVLGSSFLKCGGTYREIYDNYKHRLEHMPAHAEKTKAHRHNMAVRYAVKRFLVDLHYNWRAIEGLPVSDEYSVAKLGIIHKKAA
jgi:hypothetical protein